MADAADVYTVDQILRAKGSGKARRYHIKWKDYDVSESTWEPAENVHPTLLAEFERSNDDDDESNEESDEVASVNESFWESWEQRKDQETTMPPDNSSDDDEVNLVQPLSVPEPVTGSGEKTSKKKWRVKRENVAASSEHAKRARKVEPMSAAEATRLAAAEGLALIPSPKDSKS